MTVALERGADGVAVVRLDRPPANAIDLGLTEAAEAVFAALAREPPKAVVVTGAGAIFSAGLDLKVVPALDAAGRRALVLAINRMVRALYGLAVPTAAAINGHAMAGGLCLALACDLRLAAAGPARLALSEVNVGIPYPLGPLLVIKDVVTGALRRDLVQFGRVFDPEGARVAGLVDEIVPAEALLARARERVLALAGLRGYGAIKTQLRAEILATLDRAIAAGHDPLLDAWT
jgi:enoyl-CoA hydratase